MDMSEEMRTLIENFALERCGKPYSHEEKEKYDPSPYTATKIVAMAQICNEPSVYISLSVYAYICTWGPARVGGGLRLVCHGLSHIILQNGFRSVLNSRSALAF